MTSARHPRDAHATPLDALPSARGRLLRAPGHRARYAAVRMSGSAHALATALANALANALAAAALLPFGTEAHAAPRPQLVVIDGNQQQVAVPRPQAKLPSDADLAKVDVPAELVRLARALDAEAYADRRAAREAIVARKPQPDELMALLLRTDLGDEARHQLVGLLRDRILYAPRGALGIRMENAAAPEAGVRISGLVPGMPAEKVLKVGDILVRVNDAPLRTTFDLVSAVQSLPPGVEVKVVVRRLRRDALGVQAPAGGAGGGAAGGAAQPGQAAPLYEDVEATLRLGSTEELNEKGDANFPVPGGVGGAQGIAGGVNNFVTFERVEAARLAAKRFLGQPGEVPFPARTQVLEERPPVTVDSVRKMLMQLQLADGDADLVRIHRMRLDQIAEQMQRAVDNDTRTRLQRALEALEVEVRGSF